MRINALPIFIALAGTLSAQSPSLTLIDYPKAASTQVWAINARGEMVGMYVSADKVSHAFVLRNGQFTSIDYPGAALTLGNGIAANGDIYGEYATTSTGPHHGFVLSEGQYTTVDYPGATASFLIGAGPNGAVLGGYNLADNLGHGFMLSNGKFTSIDDPEATQTVAGGAGVNGEFLGSASVNGLSRALLYQHGKFALWDYPGGNFTNALARNAVGDIVGRWRDTSNAVHGYVLSNGKFSSFDCPGASFTGAAGITSEGDIVGRCQIDGVYHGFYLKRSLQVQYTITDLGTLGGDAATAFAVDDAGAITGFATRADGSQHPALWYDGTVMDLGTLGGPNGVAGTLIGEGLVAIAAETAIPDPLHEDFCGFGTHLNCLPAFWYAGTLYRLPTLGGANGAAINLNSRGQMAGTAETPKADPNCKAPQAVNMLPVVWTYNSMQALPLPAGDTSGLATDINDKGDAVGGTGLCGDIGINVTGIFSAARAVLWRNGVPIDLGSLYGFPGTFAYSLNNRGEVVGSSPAANGMDLAGFVWTADTGMTELPPVAPDTTSLASKINESGLIVGASCDSEGNCRGALWNQGTPVDLNTVIPQDSPLHIIFATWVNDVGEIVGAAIDKKTGDVRAFRASPVAATPPAKAAVRPVVVLPPRVRQAMRARMNPRLFGQR